MPGSCAPLTTAIFFFAAVFASFSDANAQSRVSPACADFAEFATGRKTDPRYVTGDHKPLPVLHTDSVVVHRAGRRVFEWYDGVVRPETPHIQWSTSKMLMATLLARTIQERIVFRGQPVTMNTPLHRFYPSPAFLDRTPEKRVHYEQITLGDLVEMSANFEWKEYYDGDLATSSFFPMLYGVDGMNDMAAFALRTPLHAAGPRGRWNYSGGNMNLLSGALKKIHGAGYDSMPWRLLFDPLGIRDVRIERDLSGQFVGSSYFYLSARGMAEIGELYLRGGVARDGRRLLPEGWTQAALEIAPAVLRSATDLETIMKLGAQGRRVFWLNRHIYRDDGALREAGTNRPILYPAEMPQLPSDTYFAAGHYGQIIVVVPSHGLVLARTGYDAKYWDHIQPLVAKALECYSPGFTPRYDIDLTPPSAGPKLGFAEGIWGQIAEVPGLLANLRWVRDETLSEKLVAKELCSFLFTSGGLESVRASMPSYERADERTVNWRAMKTYLDRSGLPSIVQSMLLSDMQISIDQSERSVTARAVRTDAMGQGLEADVKAQAEPDSRFGCQLVRQIRIVRPPEPSQTSGGGGGA